MLLFIECHLEELNLRGNNFGVHGVLEILQVGCRKAKYLRLLNFANNNLTDSAELLDALAGVMRSRTNIERYILAGNLLTDATAIPLITLLSASTHIKSLTLPITCSTSTIKQLESTLSKGKGGSKKKKKGKKSKK
jgi:Ran GTPase-activating protein (RanGAP) involved in mRNA processing and transport